MLFSAPNSQFFIRHYFTCLSCNLIHCFYCNKYGLIYIGGTGRSLRVRFGEHRRSVNNHDNTKYVARHFISGSHHISDMRIRALCPISGTNDSRKRQGMRLFHSLGTFRPSGINKKNYLGNGVVFEFFGFLFSLWSPFLSRVFK